MTTQVRGTEDECRKSAPKGLDETLACRLELLFSRILVLPCAGTVSDAALVSNHQTFIGLESCHTVNANSKTQSQESQVIRPTGEGGWTVF